MTMKPETLIERIEQLLSGSSIDDIEIGNDETVRTLLEEVLLELAKKSVLEHLVEEYQQ